MDGLEVSIPAKKRVFVSLFLLFWLGGWAVGEMLAINQIIEADSTEPFIIFWLGGWTLGGFFALVALAWSMAGREVITVTSFSLTISQRVFGLGRTKSYDATQIRKLRISPTNMSMSDSRSALQYWGIGGGPIAFDYGASTVHFGADIDEAEARMIVDRIGPRVPSSRT
jgi:hypothetical protein